MKTWHKGLIIGGATLAVLVPAGLVAADQMGPGNGNGNGQGRGNGSMTHDCTQEQMQARDGSGAMHSQNGMQGRNGSGMQSRNATQANRSANGMQARDGSGPRHAANSATTTTTAG